MASDHKPRPTASLTWLAAGMGLATFIVGIVMLSLVFAWARYTFASIDEQFAKVRPGPAVRQPAPTGGQPSSPTAGSGSAAGRASQQGGTVQARPGGASVAVVAAALAVKLLGLLVLGALAGMVAGRGANMVAAALRPPPVSG